MVPPWTQVNVPVRLTWTSYERGANNTEWVLDPKQTSQGVLVARSLLPKEDSKILRLIRQIHYRGHKVGPRGGPTWRGHVAGLSGRAFCFRVPFLQRAQCSHCKGCISYSNSVCPSVCLSVYLSVRHTPVLRQNGGT